MSIKISLRYTTPDKTMRRKTMSKFGVFGADITDVVKSVSRIEIFHLLGFSWFCVFHAIFTGEKAKTFPSL